MAKNKRVARRASGRHTGKRKRGSAARKKGAFKAAFIIKRAFSREVVGAILAVAGLFFTAAFLTGQGAFLGEAGLAAATRVLGLVGFALPLLAVLAGVLMLLGRLPRESSVGVALLLLAVAATLAAISDRGGLLGS